MGARFQIWQEYKYGCTHSKSTLLYPALVSSYRKPWTMRKYIDLSRVTAWHEGMAWHESIACLQPPPSLEEAILVRWCKLVAAQIGASTWPQLALVQVRRAGCYFVRLVGGSWSLGAAGPLTWGADCCCVLRVTTVGTCPSSGSDNSSDRRHQWLWPAHPLGFIFIV